MIQHLNLCLGYRLYNSTEKNLEEKEQKSFLSKGRQHQQLMELQGCKMPVVSSAPRQG